VRTNEYLDWVTRVFRDRNLIGALTGCSFVSGYVALALGHLREAEAKLSSALEVCRRGGNVLFELWILPVLAETYLRTGQRDKATECAARGFELLTPGQDWLHLVQGMLSAAERRWEDAERSFETALALNRRYELPWDEAKTLLEYGALDGTRAHGADRERSRQRFGAALEIFERLGASREMETARAALAVSA
jgi:tetratricopeptide (TPR) repeat protein